MDLARVELLKNEKIFSIPRQMAVEQSGSCSCPVHPDRDRSNGECVSYDHSEPRRGSDILLGGQEDI